jgi:DNA repair protein RecN (Recombination protein N)
MRQTLEIGLQALHGTDEQRGAVDLLGEAGVQLGLAGRLDLTLAPNGEELERLSAEVDEVGRILRSYLDRLEADPRQLEDVESRLLTFADLKRKYGETVEAILDYLEQARSRLDTGERGEALLAELAAREEQIVARLSEAAVSLSESRQAAAKPLADQVERELRELGMSGAKLRVAVHQQADPAGIPWSVEGGPERVAVDPTGADRVEFLFSANPGEPPRPLARIASGGELSRVALAMKAVLARADRRPTLIFDEVDTGVGGRLAPVVGQKLWSLTGTHQVLCVTHLPQVAAYADEHLVVAKRVEGESTRTAVQLLEADARVIELAAMLGDAHSVATAAAARELIAASSAWKRGQKTQRRSA